jgi:hypothetical protein
VKPLVKLALALCCSSIVLAAPAMAPPAHAGLADKFKKKAEKVVDDTTDKAIDEATGKPAAPAGEPSSAGSGATASTGTTKVSAVSTKFDFVPGDSVLFADDFTQDELGEFPARWTLKLGTFEVAEMAGERWLRCVSTDGTIRFKLPPGPLPELWTLEFDFFAEEPMGSALTVRGLDAAGSTGWAVAFPEGSSMAIRSGELLASTPLEGAAVPGRHHVMFLARGPALKAYIDRQRMVNMPDISAAAGLPEELDIRLWASTHPMITNVRFAEGPKPAKDLLAGGKLVTHGIRFATGSDVVQPESAPILRQVAAWLEANPAARLSITGHTDNVGKPAANLDLSQRRAAAVAKVLSAEFAVAADRLTTGGKGDTEAMAGNATAEGRAMNRRVEFAKI